MKKKDIVLEKNRGNPNLGLMVRKDLSKTETENISRGSQARMGRYFNLSR